MKFRSVPQFILWLQDDDTDKVSCNKEHSTLVIVTIALSEMDSLLNEA
jgi:hypothetical protein